MLTAVRGHFFPDAIAAMQGFRDVSLPHDACDSVTFFLPGGAQPVWLWIDDPDPAKREFYPESRRYTLVVSKDFVPVPSGEPIIMDTDDPEELVRFLQRH